MIVVTGATGQLGQLVIESLLEKIGAQQIVAAVRTPDKAKELAAHGIQIREADYSRPETLSSAFAGAEKVLLISSNDVGQRLAQHQAVVDAAVEAGVKLLAYTSILRADTSALELAIDHKQTEEYIRDSGLPFVFLRNGWYVENQTASLGAALEHGAIIGAAGDGRFAAASRKDYAEAAATVLTSEAQENKIYELGGDEPYTLSELAAEVSRQTSKPVIYHNLSKEEYAQALAGFGLPAPLAEILADADVKASQGGLDSASNELSALIGHPTTSLSDAVAEALAA
ncbi:quinone oxidoreductase 2 [Abditibacteriota bacterium]|nr:quinone oxidoreductase 2 [Abditibacteriota bacterium]